jgi:hypothetical protein
VKRIFDDPDSWLDTPNPRTRGQKPRDLIGTDDEWILRNLIRRIKHGIPS